MTCRKLVYIGFKAKPSTAAFPGLGAPRVYFHVGSRFTDNVYGMWQTWNLDMATTFACSYTVALFGLVVLCCGVATTFAGRHIIGAKV